MKNFTNIFLAFFCFTCIPLQAQWSLTGNNNISPNTNFLGTINNASLVFKTGNVERMRISTSGNVGVGTTAPGRNLHIKSLDPGIRLEGAGNYLSLRSWDIKRGAGELANLYFIEGITSGINIPGDLPDTCLTLDNRGKVGIGTTNPEQNLHIKATDNADIRLEGAGKHWNIAGGSKLYFANYDPIQKKYNDYFTILTSGNIGIGTTNPEQELHIKSVSENASLRLEGMGTHWNIAGGPKMYFANYDPVTKKYNDYLTILTSGNVGIGTTNPQSKLAVNGKITAKEVEITINGWADFVFEKDYQLKPLPEVADFIRTHKHLPDVPSETEVLNKGINISDMNKILLQKIEELTLYVIDLEQRLQSMQSANK